jgi:acyl carrier protein
MAPTEIETGVRALIAEISRQDVSSIGRNDDLAEQLGVDSLQGLQILARVEQRFRIRLPDEELIRMRTIGRIADLVERLSREDQREDQP